jgi:hypothetical protein
MPDNAFFTAVKRLPGYKNPVETGENNRHIGSYKMKSFTVPDS